MVAAALPHVNVSSWAGPGLDLAWDGGRLHVGVGVSEDVLVLTTDLGSVSRRGRRGGAGSYFLVTFARRYGPWRPAAAALRRSSSPATAAPRFCSAAAVPWPCRSGGSRPRCARWPSSSAPRARRRWCCPSADGAVGGLAAVVRVDPNDRDGKTASIAANTHFLACCAHCGSPSNRFAIVSDRSGRGRFPP